MQRQRGTISHAGSGTFLLHQYGQCLVCRDISRNIFMRAIPGRNYYTINYAGVHEGSYGQMQQNTHSCSPTSIRAHVQAPM
jgi:hypothetical protein